MMSDTVKSTQANADLDAMKANMDQFFLIVNGSIIILMQVSRNNCIYIVVQTIFTGRLCLPRSWICPEQKCDKYSDQELCGSLFWYDSFNNNNNKKTINFLRRRFVFCMCWLRLCLWKWEHLHWLLELPHPWPWTKRLCILLLPSIPSVSYKLFWIWV